MLSSMISGMATKKAMLSVSECAADLRPPVTPATVRNWIASGTLSATSFGPHATLVEAAEWDRFKAVRAKKTLRGARGAP